VQNISKTTLGRAIIAEEFAERAMKSISSGENTSQRFLSGAGVSGVAKHQKAVTEHYKIDKVNRKSQFDSKMWMERVKGTTEMCCQLNKQQSELVLQQDRIFKKLDEILRRYDSMLAKMDETEDGPYKYEREDSNTNIDQKIRRLDANLSAASKFKAEYRARCEKRDKRNAAASTPTKEGDGKTDQCLKSGLKEICDKVDVTKELPMVSGDSGRTVESDTGVSSAGECDSAVVSEPVIVATQEQEAGPVSEFTSSLISLDTVIEAEVGVMDVNSDAESVTAGNDDSIPEMSHKGYCAASKSEVKSGSAITVTIQGAKSVLIPLSLSHIQDDVRLCESIISQGTADMEVDIGAAGEGVNRFHKVAEVGQGIFDDGFARKVWDPGGKLLVLYWLSGFC
jgi:hypothetical protein